MAIYPRVCRKTSLIFFILSAMMVGLSYAQQPSSGSHSSMAYLQQQFPRLTNLYRPELEKMHTHYIFAVDVSGSMKKYDSIVTPALKAFSRSLPNGEQVTVIPFGTEAKPNVPGLEVKIQGDGTKKALETALSSLYINEGYDSKFRANTDVAKAVGAVNQSIQTNQDMDMNVVVIITDFLNDLPGQGETPIHSGTLVDLNKSFENITDGKHTRVVAMKLPPMGNMKGFCLEQLKEEVFSNTGPTRKFDVVDAISDQAAISHWFEQLSRDIMTEKLKAFIEIDNEKNLNPSLKTNIDINGNTTAEIHWKPNKLYTQIKIDSTYTDAGSNLIFKNNKKVWQITTDTVLKDLKLGKLEHKNIGLHQYDEALNLGLSLPTEYDDELKKLNIEKPIPNTSTEQKGWLWTFWLSFWVTVTLAAIILIYLFLVAKAARRNATEKFSGTVEIVPTGRNTKDTKRYLEVRKKNKFKIGNGGTGNTDLPNVPWWILVEKKTPYNPFSLKKPVFICKTASGFVQKSKKNIISRYPTRSKKISTGLMYYCGTSTNDITHVVTIKINKKK